MNSARTRRSHSRRSLIFWALMLSMLSVPQLLNAEEGATTPNRGAASGDSLAPSSAQGKRGKRRRSSASKSRSRSKSSSRSRSKAKRGRTSRRAPRKVTAPVELSIGPGFFVFANPISDGEVLSGPLTQGQMFHYGLNIDLAAIITYEFVRKNPRLVPRKYRSMFKPGSEVRFTPGILSLIPRNIILSPKFNDTGMYGATWELLAAGIDLLKSPKADLNIGAGLLATYVYIDSDLTDASTHFLRPGVSLGLSTGAMLTDTLGLRIGWNSNFYIPQEIGGGILDMGEGERSLWHIGEAYIQLRVRFPYTTTL